LGNTNEIIGCPIYREVSGLAMSSRNQRLSEQQKVQATLLYQIMKYIKEHLNTMSWAELKSWAELQFEKDKDWQLEYLTLADSQTLEKKDDYSKDKPLRIFIAAHLGTVRLIDNMAVN
jgi:pantoate--beta-alanine ligase